MSRENIEVCSSLDVNASDLPKCVAIKLTAIIPSQILVTIFTQISQKKLNFGWDLNI